MATSKQYAYYLEGNQIAIVEKDVSFDNDVDSKDYGPGASRQRWESPQSTVSDGLEIKHTYASTYNINSTFTYTTDVVRINGWGSNGENLVLFATHATGTSIFDWTTISGSFAVNDWVYIRGGRWRGLHKIKARGDQGILTLFTEYSKTPAYIPLDIDVSTAGVVSGDDTDANKKLSMWYDETSSKENLYFFINNLASSAQGGLFKVTWVNDNSFTLDTRYLIDSDKDFTSETPDFSGDAVNNDSVLIYDAHYEEIDLLTNIDVMEDESFELDLPNYLQKALVYYVKAKVAEDAMNIKARDYAMREFKKMIEKHENSRISGLRIISPGSHAIR